MKKTKFCNKCKETKLFTDFCNDKTTKDKMACYCRLCQKIDKNYWRQTRDGVITIIYSSQKQHSKKKGFPPPAYSREQFSKWAYSQANFDELYLNWINSGYDILVAKWNSTNVISYHHPSIRCPKAMTYSLLGNVYKSEVFRNL